MNIPKDKALFKQFSDTIYKVRAQRTSIKTSYLQFPSNPDPKSLFRIASNILFTFGLIPAQGKTADSWVVTEVTDPEGRTFGLTYDIPSTPEEFFGDFSRHINRQPSLRNYLEKIRKQWKSVLLAQLAEFIWVSENLSRAQCLVKAAEALKINYGTDLRNVQKMQTEGRELLNLVILPKGNGARTTKKLNATSPLALEKTREHIKTYEKWTANPAQYAKEIELNGGLSQVTKRLKMARKFIKETSALPDSLKPFLVTKRK